MKKILLLICFVIMAWHGYSQDSTVFRSKNAIYLEALGNSPNYTINYDRLLWSKNKFHFGARIGVGAWYRERYPLETKPYMLSWFFPTEFYALYGKKSSFLEASLGYTNSIAKHLYYLPNPERGIFIVQRNTGFLIGRLGYRRQSKEGGFVFRSGITAFYNDSPWQASTNTYYKVRLIIFGGINLGWSF